MKWEEEREYKGNEKAKEAQSKEDEDKMPSKNRGTENLDSQWKVRKEAAGAEKRGEAGG